MQLTSSSKSLAPVPLPKKLRADGKVDVDVDDDALHTPLEGAGAKALTAVAAMAP